MCAIPVGFSFMHQMYALRVCIRCMIYLYGSLFFPTCLPCLSFCQTIYILFVYLYLILYSSLSLFRSFSRSFSLYLVLSYLREAFYAFPCMLHCFSHLPLFFTESIFFLSEILHSFLSLFLSRYLNFSLSYLWEAFCAFTRCVRLLKVCETLSSSNKTFLRTFVYLRRRHDWRLSFQSLQSPLCRANILQNTLRRGHCGEAGQKNLIFFCGILPIKLLESSYI